MNPSWNKLRITIFSQKSQQSLHEWEIFQNILWSSRTKVLVNYKGVSKLEFGFLSNTTLYNHKHTQHKAISTHHDVLRCSFVSGDVKDISWSGFKFMRSLDGLCSEFSIKLQIYNFFFLICQISINKIVFLFFRFPLTAWNKFGVGGRPLREKTVSNWRIFSENGDWQKSK